MIRKDQQSYPINLVAGIAKKLELSMQPQKPKATQKPKTPKKKKGGKKKNKNLSKKEDL